VLLANRVAIVTGAATGIGKGISLRFAAEGCKVVAVDISENNGRKTVDAIAQKGGPAIFIKCNITDNRQVQEMVDKASAHYGKIDILVNNAGGVAGDGKIEDVSEEDWRKVVDLNLFSQFFCCKAVVPYMKKNEYGKIVNVSSMGAIHPPAPIIHYHAAKGGVLGLTTNLALELASCNITVNAILPGPILTEFFTDILKTKPDPDAFLKSLGKKVPMQRMGTPEDIAGVALFLASELSSYVTAEAICVGGGLPLAPMEIVPQ
jgi:NAD(P)-dependent dehydrogenase (short-subunit alcohol dehydrogenase family)